MNSITQICVSYHFFFQSFQTMIITLECLYLTSTILLVVVAAVSHVQTAVVTVAGLGVEVEDDVVGVDVVPSADLTVGVLPLAALPGSPTAP